MTRLAITTRTQARKRRGKMTRLTDSDIANMLDDNTARLTGVNRDAYMTADEAVKLLGELRERREADLSSFERTVLATIRDDIAEFEHHDVNAVRVLDKLLTAARSE